MADLTTIQQLRQGSRGPALVGVQVVMMCLALISVTLRFVARRMSAAGFWWDDWTILAALVCVHLHEATMTPANESSQIPSLAINVVNILGETLVKSRENRHTDMTLAVRLGLGKHIWEVEDRGKSYLKTLLVTELVYTTALALNKLSVLLMYKRLFGIERRFLRTCYIIMGAVLAWWIGVEVATLVRKPSRYSSSLRFTDRADYFFIVLVPV